MSKYNRTYHLPWSPGTTSDDRIAKDTSNLIGVPIVITEKLDGENTGITNKGVYARSHAAFTVSPWSREVRQLQNIIKEDIEEDVILFGENMEGIHSINYECLSSYFYLFGIRNESYWLSWQEIEEYAFLLDLQTVPVLYKGIVNSEKELKEITDSLVFKESALCGMREGVVVRTQDGFNDEDFALKVMKWVRKDHVQTDEHWTKNWKKAIINERDNIILL